MPDHAAGASLLETARAFRPRILAERERIENGRRLPHVEAAIGFRHELARADASVAWCVWNGNTHWTTV